MDLRSKILQTVELPREAVQAWGTTVWVRAMSGTERDAFEDANIETRGRTIKAVRPNFRARLAVACLCDEAGSRLFKPEDATALGQTSSTELDKVVKVAARLNGMTAEEIEEAEKN